ncbi:Myb DNA-bind 3 domain-containing protein [Abeliophyllum distichum]|uniref:Myb DNA-bind 3 domain-containing protein n=1 Tax=Abeliophyllum distichum TaxID=126358 RepID=A0ABD1Q2X9_9LAMI
MDGHRVKNNEPMSWSDENEHAFIEILYEKVKSNTLQYSTFTKDEWRRINATMNAKTKMDYGVERLKGKWNRLRKINKLDYKIFKREGCKHYHILGEIFSGTTATGGLGNTSTQLPTNSEEERQLEDDFLNEGVHVHVENLDDSVDEVPKTRRREEIGTSGERRRKEPKISKSDKLEACMEQWSSPVSLKNEETELRTLYLKEKLSKMCEKSCNQSDSEATSLDPYSNIVCLDLLNNMERVSNEVYMKAIKAFKDPDFRVLFVKMPEARRGPILKLL